MGTQNKKDPPKAPLVFDYIEAADYLKDFIAFKKKTSPRYSLRQFSKQAGFNSPGYMPMVLAGKREVAPNSISRLAMALDLKAKESLFFEALVMFSQARDDAQRDFYFDRMRALKPQEKTSPVTADTAAFFSRFYFPIIHQMLLLPDFEDSPEWISERIYPRLTPAQVQQALDIMLRLGLIRHDAKKGLVVAKETIETDPEVDSFDVYEYHAGHLASAKLALTKVPQQLRDITAVTIPLSLKKLPALKKKVEDFRSEIVDWINRSDKDPFDEVVQINIQVYPATFKRSKQEHS